MDASRCDGVNCRLLLPLFPSPNIALKVQGQWAKKMGTVGIPVCMPFSTMGVYPTLPPLTAPRPRMYIHQSKSPPPQIFSFELRLHNISLLLSLPRSANTTFYALISIKLMLPSLSASSRGVSFVAAVTNVGPWLGMSPGRNHAD